METQKAVVFDVGKVLVDFCFENFKAYLGSHGAIIESTEEFFSKSQIFEYEKGGLECDKFFANIIQILGSKPSRSEVEKQWRNIFTPNDEMFKLLSLVSRKHPTYLLSNTNPSHWIYLEENFQLSSYVLGLMTSFEAKSMKPEERIYECLIKKYSLTPEEIIFIDDLEQNTQAARKLGWNTIHHTSIETTRSQLESLKII